MDIDIMKGISEAILEDVRSPMTSPRLQYTMGQCFTKVVKAVRIYASTDQKEVRDFFAGLIADEHLGCLGLIRNAGENLEKLASSTEFVDRPIAEVLHTPQWETAIQNSAPGTGGQAQLVPSTSAGSTSREIDNFVQLCGRKVVLPDDCLKCLNFAEQYVENEELLAASQRWLGNATDDEKASDEGTNCQLDIENRLNIQRTSKQEG